MGTKVRKQLYIEPDQEALLKRLSRKLGITEAEIVRRALAHLSTTGAPIRDLKGWEKEKEFIKKRARKKARPTQPWTREELHDR
ncbi:MAG: Uncharacterized protein XD60_0838 [Acetothermia bacterium 64_32]|nr:MAG: Uncharacterized protein XD60_0838 [Acetothermia bacterium 64_32]HAF70686.1 hypothetical protein [Candidatus Acetothermia bacterium]